MPKKEKVKKTKDPIRIVNLNWKSRKGTYVRVWDSEKGYYHYYQYQDEPILEIYRRLPQEIRKTNRTPEGIIKAKTRVYKRIQEKEGREYLREAGLKAHNKKRIQEAFKKGRITLKVSREEYLENTREIYKKLMSPLIDTTTKAGQEALEIFINNRDNIDQMKHRFICYLEPQGEVVREIAETGESINLGEKVLANTSLKAKTIDETISLLQSLPNGTIYRKHTVSRDQDSDFEPLEEHVRAGKIDGYTQDLLAGPGEYDVGRQDKMDLTIVFTVSGGTI